MTYGLVGQTSIPSGRLGPCPRCRWFNLLQEAKGGPIRSSRTWTSRRWGDGLPCSRVLTGHVLALDHQKTDSESWPCFERR